MSQHTLPAQLKADIISALTSGEYEACHMAYRKSYRQFCGAGLVCDVLIKRGLIDGEWRKNYYGSGATFRMRNPPDYGGHIGADSAAGRVIGHAFVDEIEARFEGWCAHHQHTFAELALWIENEVEAV